MNPEPKPAWSYLSPGEAAKRLGISPSTLKRWRAQSYGPPWCEVRRMIRYRDDKLEAWTDSLTVNPSNVRKFRGRE